MSATATLGVSTSPVRPIVPEPVDRTEAFCRPSRHPVSAPAHLLLLDEDRAGLVGQLRQAFPVPGFRVRTGSVSGGLRQVCVDPPDVIVLELDWSESSGLETYRQIREVDPRVPVVFVTGATRADAAIKAMKQGAYDVLFKPVEPALLRRVVGEALEAARRMRQPAVLADASPDWDEEGAFVGSCPAMGEVYKAVGRVAAQDVPVLITGESGTGKELVARALYQNGPRAEAPFLALNCAAIPENLLESELFGHEKGAFTGADRKRVGKFEQCHGGTLLLDEIGDMSLALQAKMLRVLQEQTFERVGGGETVRTDVRIISATHRDLKALVAAGRFRADLYYRLGVFAIHLPRLRDRGDDLPLLVKHFVRRFSRELGREVREVSAEAMAALRAYPWPGNVRELQSVLKQALLRATGPVLLPAMLPDLGAAPAPPEAAGAGRPGLVDLIRKRLAGGCEDLYDEAHRELDRTLLPLVLEHTGGSQHQVARRLGIARETLRRRLRELGLQVTRTVEPVEEDLS